MSAPVFVAVAAGDARPGDTLILDGPEGHHAATVQRLGVGELIEVVDGHGARAAGVVAAATTGRLEVRVDAVSRDDDPPLVLVQALAKGGRDEAAVEAATELGVTRIVPWAASRCVVEWRGEKATRGRARWEAVVLAAAKQSRRALVPAVDDVVGTAGLVALVSAARAAGERVLLLHEEAETPIVEAIQSPLPPTWLIVGPEGGVSESELLELVVAGATPVRLGPHVLRTSTAGPAAAAVVLACTGQWTSSGEDDSPQRTARTLG